MLIKQMSRGGHAGNLDLKTGIFTCAQVNPAPPPVRVPIHSRGRRGGLAHSQVPLRRRLGGLGRPQQFSGPGFLVLRDFLLDLGSILLRRGRRQVGSQFGELSLTLFLEPGQLSGLQDSVTAEKGEWRQ